jgi:Fe-S-cluster-containing dehydrogenase component/formate-dependent nitrite reductase membrane component NrfD
VGHPTLRVTAIRYGFVIDNRKCIGCHACTVACKSEHDVPIGVNRTWVKQVETGEFPDVRRSFHVMRCNHCADAPCTEICPTSALYTRDDGIVDFDNRRCIGCKGCMQACPYDALYIDPDSHTAAKCNFCSHRVDRGLQPACVVACPEQAIIAGDVMDAGSFISQLLATQPVQVRRPEKGTLPSLYYIDGDRSALEPLATDGQARSVAVESKPDRHGCDTTASPAPGADVRPLAGLGVAGFLGPDGAGAGKGIPRKVYDAPKNGVLWGWEVSAYLSTKAVAAGVLLVPLLVVLVAQESVSRSALLAAGVLSLLMQAATGALLVADLDRPDRFLYVLLRGNPRSWLVRGAWILSAFGAASSAWLLSVWLEWGAAQTVLAWATLALSLPTAVYTAFLFAQAKGRDLWQSPLAPLHMLAHAAIAGGAATLLLEAAMRLLPHEEPGLFHLLDGLPLWGTALTLLVGGLIVDLLLAWGEIALPHSTAAAGRAAQLLHTGLLSRRFWFGFVGCALLALLLLGPLEPLGLWWVGAIAALVSLVARNDVWVRAPQMVPMS